VRPNGNEYFAFVICCISRTEFVAYTDRTSGGTKMPRTSWDIMARYPVVIPPGATARAFETMIAPSLERIIANTLESHALTQTRDLLLPKLMSGQIRVTDAGKQAEGSP
jgi:type I restriction enzyme, S subunit